MIILSVLVVAYWYLWGVEVGYIVTEDFGRDLGEIFIMEAFKVGTIDFC